MADPGAAADGGRDAGFPGLTLNARPPLLSSGVRLRIESRRRTLLPAAVV